MAIEERVQCPACRRAVVPRLWLIDGGMVSYMRTQHICPFCGVVMYETGGGYKRRDLITVIVCGLLTLAILIAMFLIGQWAPR